MPVTIHRRGGDMAFILPYQRRCLGGRMRVLVTGGSGVVGEATVTALTRAGHDVRLFSRNAEKDVGQWPERVEPREGDIGHWESVQGAADGCDAIVHLVGIVAESPPE